MEPLVSILVPCRNAAPWLEAALASAVGQSWPRCEVIVVDDGSTDASAALAARFADRGVALLTQPAAGAAAARNRALAVAQGEFIQYLDADDRLHADKIRLQLATLAAAPAGTVGVSSIAHFADGSDPAGAPIEAGWPMTDSDDPAGWLVALHGGDGRRGMVQTSQWLVPRAVADAAGPWDESLSLDDDGEYFARVVLAARALRFTPASLVYYRKHAAAAGNLSGRGHASAAHLASGLRALQARARRLLAVRDEPRTRRALAGCFSQLAVLAYPRHLDLHHEAREEVRRLGGPFTVPPLGARADLLRRFVGWKLARRLGALARA